MQCCCLEMLQRGILLRTSFLVICWSNQLFVQANDWIRETDNTDEISFFPPPSAVGQQISFFPPPSAVGQPPRKIAVGASISCMLNGRPDSSLKWYGEYWKTVSWVSDLSVTRDMLCWDQPITLSCRAKYGAFHSYGPVEGNYTFFVVDSPSITCGVEPWVIAVAVIVPSVAIAAIAIAVFFIIRHRKKKRESREKKMNKGSTSALLLNY